MKKNLYTLVFGLVLYSLALPSVSHADGTPAEETVCDELKGGTPGLYGLCVAYCEAQDLDESELERLAFGSERTVRRTLRRNTPNQRILEIYEQKKTESDPDMPCINQDSACPCFSMENLGIWAAEYGATASSHGPSTYQALDATTFNQAIITETQCTITDVNQVIQEVFELIVPFASTDDPEGARNACIENFEGVFPPPAE